MRARLVPAVLAFCAAAAAAMATTPFQANVADTACNGERACKLAFPVVAAGETLTVEHVSCGLTTAGEEGGIYTLLLTSAKAPPSTDFLLPLQLLAGSNIRSVVNAATLFTVKAGDRAEVSVTGNSTVIGGGGDGCFISGVETP